MKTYSGEKRNDIAYPLGGMGAGTMCLTGWGSLDSVSLRHRPEKWFCPTMFSAVTLLGDQPVARLLEAPVPKVHYYTNVPNANRGFQVTPRGRTFGLPRFREGAFSAAFPFATLKLEDPALPLAAALTGWSPFVPGRADDSSLPFAGLEYTLQNTGDRPLQAVYSFNAFQFIGPAGNPPRPIENGFVFEHFPADDPAAGWAFAACADGARVDDAWYRSNWWFDALTMQWNRICGGLTERHGTPDPERGGSPGASLFVPLSLAPGESKTIALRLCWYAPQSALRIGRDDDGKSEEERRALPAYRPWYTTVIHSIDDAAAQWAARYGELRRETRAFTDALLQSDLPDALLEAVSANLCVLKSPTVLRQTDGRMWAWEGCNDDEGSCHGSCTHVWNYAQAVCHLFPELERGLRQTEFFDCQDDRTGHQEFRAYLPIRKTLHTFYAAADGQLGGIIKTYRDWRICGDTHWLRGLWPRVRQSLRYCIDAWDPGREGVLRAPHHNTYDIEFYGPDSLGMTFYTAALKAAAEMAKALGEDGAAYAALYRKARRYLEDSLFNGEYFIQRVERETAAAQDSFKPLCYTPPDELPSEVRRLMAKQPPYQYGEGCLSDGVLGIWLGELAGLSDIVDEEKLLSALHSIFRYNFRENFYAHANPQRAGYAAADEAGLLLCSWPHGGKPPLPFVYSDEVWTGIEYQVASHLLMKGRTDEGVRIVRAARARYDGQTRNPFSEYECGEWYARSLASYALLEGYTGVRYDALTRTLTASRRNAKTFRCFFACGEAYGIVSLCGESLTFEPVRGELKIRHYVIED